MREILTLNVLYNQRAQKCEKCSKTFCKIFGRYLENMQNQTNIKYSSAPKDILNQLKKIKKLNPKEDSLKLTYLKFLAKFLTETKPYRSNTTFSTFSSSWHVVR